MLRLWLKHWAEDTNATGRAAPGRRGVRRAEYRPQLEHLEDRCVPSAIRDLPGFRANVLPANDDGSTATTVPLGFTVNMFGLIRNSVYVNNNGNVTFDNPLSQFTPDDLTTPGQPPIIAAFFADVDTRGKGSGLVTYGQDVVDGRKAFGVDYFNVGYFAQKVDKLNTFQLIIIENCDKGSTNFDIEFNYQTITWETGDASGGTGGLGGTPAHVGFTNGTGVPGTFYEVPGSGVSGAFLDGGPKALNKIRINAETPGRIRFLARDGTVLIEPPLRKTVFETIYAIGADTGGAPQVQVYDAISNRLKFSFLAYDANFRGGVRVATGDVNGDGFPDIITAPGPGGGPNVRVFDGKNLTMIDNFMAFAPTFTAGLYVSGGDINYDLRDDIIVTPDTGGGPNVRVFDGLSRALLRNFSAFDPRFTGGVRVAADDLNDDGYADMILGAGPGGGPNVRVFDGKTNAVRQSFMAYDRNFTGGVYVATGIFAEDATDSSCRHPNIITGPGVGGGANVIVYDGLSGAILQNFMAPPQSFINSPDGLSYFTGARVSSIDHNNSKDDDILIGYGSPSNATANIYRFRDAARINSFFPLSPLFTGGLYVASGH